MEADPRRTRSKVGGTIHKPMYERLILCDYAIADVTGANPNVYYELGIRHAVRPRSTVILFADGTLLPFDIALLRGMPYRTDGSGGPANAAERQPRRLPSASREVHAHGNRRQPAVSAHRRHAAHRDRSRQDRHLSGTGRLLQDYKTRLATARKADGLRDKAARQKAVGATASEFAVLQDVEAGIIIDLFLSLSRC